MEGGARGRFFRRILGEKLGPDSCTRFYRELEFCLNVLHLPYGEYLALPSWERRMYKIYFDIKDKKEEYNQLMADEENRKLANKGYE